MRPVGSLIVFFIILGVLYFYALSRAPDMVSNYLSTEIGVSVSIDGIKPGLRKITVNQFDVANEEGYSLPKAFSAKTITLNAPLTQYLNDPIVVEQIDVDAIYLGIEFDTTTSTEGNWSKLLSHYQKEAKLDAKDGKKVIIKKMVFTNIQADLIFHSGENKIQKLPKIPRIEITDVSTEGGFPVDQLTSSMLGQLIKQAFIQYHMENFLQMVPEKAIELFLKPLKGIFSMKEEENLKYADSFINI